MPTLPKLLVLSLATALVACSINQVTFRELPDGVGGTLTGLQGTGLVLTNNGGDDLALTADGAFSFAAPVERGAGYAVAVKTQPSHPTQICSVSQGTGTTGDGNVTDVQVSCRVTGFSVSGTVTGLRGTGLVLQNNAGDDLRVNADGAFTFATPVASRASYEVTVVTQPTTPSQVCTVAGGAGTIDGENITGVAVSCATSAFTIGGSVTGLAGAGLVLQDNAGDDLAIGGNGSFAFATPVASGASFRVTVRTQPSQPTQTCTVLGNTGTVGGGNVTSVAINCQTNRYMISGAISGLVGTVTLENNAGDDLDVTSNGTFAFATSVPSGSAYAVTVNTQPAPPSQTCTVTSAAGTVGSADITNVVVACSTNVFTISGTVSGLAPGDSITLSNNGRDDLTQSTDGGFTFATPVASGQPYVVSVLDPPSPIAQTCTITGGAGTITNASITNVTISCVGTPPSSGSFFYSASNTSSATQNTVNVDLSIAAGQVLTIGTCGVPGASGTGDTFLRVFSPVDVEVAFNDDACGGLLTNLTYVAVTTGVFHIHAGCFSTQACDGTVAYTLSGT
jgi:hypothetical protein